MPHEPLCYDEALAEGPDFINYRGKSAFLAAPRLGIDRNAYARILNALEAIEQGTYRTAREKGKQGIPQAMSRMLKALLNLALQYGEVRPSLVGIARMACACKQTVVNCLKLLSLYGFVIVHGRIKRIRTALGLQGGARHQRLHDPGARRFAYRAAHRQARPDANGKTSGGSHGEVGSAPSPSVAGPFRPCSPGQPIPMDPRGAVGQ